MAAVSPLSGNLPVHPARREGESCTERSRAPAAPPHVSPIPLGPPAALRGPQVVPSASWQSCLLVSSRAETRRPRGSPSLTHKVSREDTTCWLRSEPQEAVPAGEGHAPEAQDKDQEPGLEVFQGQGDGLDPAKVQAQCHPKQDAQRQP